MPPLRDRSVTKVSTEGDPQLAQLYVPQALHLLDRLLARLKVGNITTGASAYRVDDHCHVYARVSDGINAVHIVVTGSPSQKPKVVHITVPDFLSGTVHDGYLTNGVLDSFAPTQRCSLYRPSLIPRALQKIKRLAIPPSQQLPEIQSPQHSHWQYSQYTMLKPSCYSGKMKQVVQFLMGIGRLPSAKASLYRFLIPDIKTFYQANDLTPPAVTPYFKKIADAGVQIEFDYKFARTHGIYTAPDGKLWLVEISITHGVIARPLPMFEITTTSWFRQHLETLDVQPHSDEPIQQVREDDGLGVLDALGGFPTGEGFATGNAFDAWVRAGETIQLLEPDALADFYSNSFYSSAMGWAFSKSGKEAHNTCWRYGDDGIQEGLHYAIALNLGAMPELTVTKEHKALIDKLEQVRDQYPELVDPAIFKVKRMSAYELSDYADLSAQRALAAIDALQMQPFVTASANVSLSNRGKLYNPGKKPTAQFKFWEPLVGYCVSHDWFPAWSSDAAGTRADAPECDTVMQVFFQGEQLKKLRYFRSGKDADQGQQVSDNFESCMYVGQWKRTTTHGFYGAGRGFYSEDLDFIHEYHENRSVETIKGEDYGWCRAVYADDIVDQRVNHMHRYRRFRRRTQTESYTGKSVGTACMWPAFDREAYYLAVFTSMQSYSKTVDYAYQELVDPHSGEGWRCFPSVAGPDYWPADILSCGNRCPEYVNYSFRKGDFSNARICRFTYYNPYPCSDFADKGEWLHKCDNFTNMAFDIPEPPLPSEPSVNTGYQAELDVWLCTGDDPFLIRADKVVTKDPYMSPLWFVPSPDPETGLTQAIYETHNCLGSATHLIYDAEPNSGSSKSYGTDLPYKASAGSVTFIGIVEE